MKIIVIILQTLYYDAPPNTSRDDDDDDDEDEEDPKNCSKIAQNRVCCTLGYIYKHIGTRKFLTKALWVYSHLKSEFFFSPKSYLIQSNITGVH